MRTRSIAAMGVLLVCSLNATGFAGELEKLVMPGKVIDGHAEYEHECDRCHVVFARDRQRDLCLACHEDVATDIGVGSGYHGRDDAARNGKCAACHADHQGRDAEIAMLDRHAFDHRLTDFGLSGAHLDADCADCHAVGAEYREAPTGCYACHAEDDAHAEGLGRTCGDCHDTVDWQTTRFDHRVATGFALTGGHRQAQCTACHENHVYADAPTDCYSCHRADDSHDGLNGTDCGACHDTGIWTDTRFDHARETGFALTGRHADSTCGACHTSAIFEVELSTDCYSCHRHDDEHAGINGQDCGSCHDSSGWLEVSFDHDADTAFRLVGAHRGLSCNDCHAVPVSEASPETECLGCHRDEDPHAGQLGDACNSCHGEIAWTQSVRFDHDLTGFPLIGAHAGAECAGCHESQRFKDAAEACVDCHLADDTHRGNLGPDCGDCHNPVDWRRWEFDHDLRTSFRIDGAHRPLRCADCHKWPAAEGVTLDSRCVACHRGDDVHRGDFGTDCGRCHTTADFRSVDRKR